MIRSARRGHLLRSKLSGPREALIGRRVEEGGTNSAHAEEGLEGCRKSGAAGVEVEGVAEDDDLVVAGPAERRWRMQEWQKSQTLHSL